MIKFSVSGDPRPRQSVRSRIAKKADGSQFIHHYQKKDDRVANWINLLRVMAQQSAPPELLAGPIAMKIRIRRLRTGTYRKKDPLPYKRPDIDNYMKPLLDSFTGVIYRDDAQICRLVVSKVFDGVPGVDITIEEIKDE